MTKAIIQRSALSKSPRPPSEVCNLSQRLQAADEAWQSFVRAQERPDDSCCVPHAMSVLSTFSRFLHELIPDQQIRGHLLKNFEQQILQADAFKQGAMQ